MPGKGDGIAMLRNKRRVFASLSRDLAASVNATEVERADKQPQRPIRVFGAV